jgi:hypothetical protein
MQTIGEQYLELAHSDAKHAAAARRMTWAEGDIEFDGAIGLAGNSAWTHELRGAHGEWTVLGKTGHPVHDKGMTVVHPDYGTGKVTSITGASTVPRLPMDDPFYGPTFKPGWNRHGSGQAIAHVTFANGKKADFPYVNRANQLYQMEYQRGLQSGPDITLPPTVQDTGGMFYAPHLPKTNGSLSDLTPAEQKSIMDYVSPNDNPTISSFLRKGTAGQAYNDIQARGTIEELDSAESKITLAEPYTMYRGIALTPALAKKIKTGATFTDKDFVSSSTSQDWANTFAQLRATGRAKDIGAEVKAEGGTPLRMALHLQPGQHIMPGEGDLGEYILPRGSSFHVNSIAGGQADITVTSPAQAPALSTIGQQFMELSWRDAWRTELRGKHGEWEHGGEGDEISRLESQISRTEHISKSDAAAAGKLISKSVSVVPHMFGPDTHLDWDGKPPTMYSKWSQNMGKDLAIMDWNGHMDMRNDVAEGIADAESHPGQPVKVPGAYAVTLHELIHAVVPQGETRDTNGDKEAYNATIGNADMEEGFTELGAIQHAGEYFDKLGIGDRQINIPHAPAGATMLDLAANNSSPDAIRHGKAWGHYPVQTAQAFEWASMTAQFRTGKPESDPDTTETIRDIADEVNAVGTAAKPLVMARQAIGDMLPPDQAQANRLLVESAMSITRDWNEGSSSAPGKIRAAAAQRLQQLQAEAERGGTPGGSSANGSGLGSALDTALGLAGSAAAR